MPNWCNNTLQVNGDSQHINQLPWSDRDTERITDTHCLKSEIGLKRLNLAPKGVEPVAVYWRTY
ncbi:MAG: hypothetical protein AAFO95_20510 [Cyanobacteria bacterium J06600_6]